MSVNETKNTTILAMDVVCYSAKMNEDERGTTEKLKNARKIIEKFAHHSLGNINKANEYFSVIKPLYGEDPINTMLEGMKMWNNHIAFQEYIKFELENNYGYN